MSLQIKVPFFNSALHVHVQRKLYYASIVYAINLFDLDRCSIMSIFFVLDFIHHRIVSVAINLKLRVGFSISIWHHLVYSTNELYHCWCVQLFLLYNASGFSNTRFTSSVFHLLVMVFIKH